MWAFPQNGNSIMVQYYDYVIMYYVSVSQLFALSIGFGITSIYIHVCILTLAMARAGMTAWLGPRARSSMQCVDLWLRVLANWMVYYTYSRLSV